MGDVAARCAGCSADFGLLSDDEQDERIRRHFATCTKHLDGEGLIKMQGIVWTIVEDVHA